MRDAVFISDLHLHPDDKEIHTRFNDFLAWARISVKTVYILGDFFHAWAGDDSINEWSLGIAGQLRFLVDNGIKVFYMHGNRDFLLGRVFSQHAGWLVLAEPTVITLGKDRILLVHGDCYCTKDKAHQRFRLLTRNRLFSALFLALPLTYREALVNKVRTISQSNPSKSVDEMDVVPEAVIKHMKKHHVHYLIHGHTHKPGLTGYEDNLKRFVLSDWDDKPLLLCYDNTKGLYFTQY